MEKTLNMRKKKVFPAKILYKEDFFFKSNIKIHVKEDVIKIKYLLIVKESVPNYFFQENIDYKQVHLYTIKNVTDAL